MNMLDRRIVIAPDPCLAREAERVKVGDSENELLDLMWDAMHNAGGIGLAAPQVGVGKRVIVADVEPLDAYDDGDKATTKHGRFEMVNPVIVHREGKAKWVEGCLSVPGFSDTVERDRVIEVSYVDRYGRPIELRAAGLLSACIQHELDHLDGVLFIDRMSRLKRDLVIAKLRKLKKRGRMTARDLPQLVL